MSTQQPPKRRVPRWPEFPGRPYTIRPVRSRAELDAVYRLTHDSIVAAGYMAPRPDGRLFSYPTLDTAPESTILVAVQNGVVIGTNSLIADGPRGLHTDKYFGEATNRVRSERRRLISSFRIATRPGYDTSQLVMDLIRATFFFALRKYRFDTMLCTFNPKHERVYSRLLGAHTLARQDALPDDGIAAGSVLMRIDRRTLPPDFKNQLRQLLPAP